MILISENETKKIYFYLTSTIPNPTFIFKFISNDTENETLMISENLSQYPTYQSFTFSNGSTYSLLGGFDLIPGTYDYVIYQSQYNDLNVASASGILETGLMTITKSPTSSCYVWQVQPETDYVYYEPCPPTPPGLTGI
jgi:hypothetical protein